jgi:hypothetical protein
MVRHCMKLGHCMQRITICINYLLSKAKPRSQVVRLMFITFGCWRMFHLVQRYCVMLRTQSKTISRKNSFLTVHHCTKYVTVPRKVRIVCVLMLADVGMLLKHRAVLVDATNKVLLRRGHSYYADGKNLRIAFQGVDVAMVPSCGSKTQKVEKTWKCSKFQSGG